MFYTCFKNVFYKNDKNFFMFFLFANECFNIYALQEPVSVS